MMKKESNDTETKDSLDLFKEEVRKTLEEKYYKILAHRQELYAQGLTQEEVDEAMLTEDV